MAGRRLRVHDTDRSVDAANLTHRYHAVLRAAGLPHQRFHDLRHACATMRLEQGEELAVVSRVLGHASITTTANVDGPMTDAMLGRAADRTDVILGSRAATLAWVWVFLWVLPESTTPGGRPPGVVSRSEWW